MVTSDLAAMQPLSAWWPAQRLLPTSATRMPAVLITGHTTTLNSPFLLQWWPKTIVTTHCSYSRRDGQAEVAVQNSEIAQ